MQTSRAMPDWGREIFSEQCIMIRPDSADELERFFKYAIALTRVHLRLARNAEPVQTNRWSSGTDALLCSIQEADAWAARRLCAWMRPTLGSGNILQGVPDAADQCGPAEVQRAAASQQQDAARARVFLLEGLYGQVPVRGNVRHGSSCWRAGEGCRSEPEWPDLGRPVRRPAGFTSICWRALRPGAARPYAFPAGLRRYLCVAGAWQLVARSVRCMVVFRVSVATRLIVWRPDQPGFCWMDLSLSSHYGDHNARALLIDQ